jgi:hypothetical protein
MSVSFFEAKHRSLRNDYHDESGEYADSCSLIALDMAALLLSRGEQPKILRIQGKPEEIPGILSNGALVPIPYQGRVTWGAHIVCESAGIVHDPMLETPLPLADYLSAAFAQQVDIEDISSYLRP